MSRFFTSIKDAADEVCKILTEQSVSFTCKIQGGEWVVTAKCGREEMEEFIYIANRRRSSN